MNEWMIRIENAAAAANGSATAAAVADVHHWQIEEWMLKTDDVLGKHSVQRRIENKFAADAAASAANTKVING